MPVIKRIVKPTIRLVGDILTSGGVFQSFSESVDHSISVTSATNIVSSPTTLDKSNLLNFQNYVRIIITGQISPKFNYFRRDNEPSEFEGNVTFNTSSNDPINNYAETFYTLNGKDPVRTANYLYTATDYDNYSRDYSEARHDPSANDINPSSVTDNIDQLGFLLKVSPTGDDFITLKARTFYRGQKSDVTAVYFKIHRTSPSIVIDNAGTG